jgi:hypothetical protein
MVSGKSPGLGDRSSEFSASRAALDKLLTLGKGASIHLPGEGGFPLESRASRYSS